MEQSFDDHRGMGTDQGELVASIEDDPIAQSLGARTTFIPFRQRDLVRDLIERYQIEGSDRTLFSALSARLKRIFHAEHLAQLLRLEEIYGPLDPDSQLVELHERDKSQREQLTEKLFDRISGLLFSAHYKRLDRSDLRRAVDMASQWGVRLQVNFDLYERLEIFARGYHVVEHERRRWQNFFRKETIELPEFERLIMAFRLKEEVVRQENASQAAPEEKQNRRKQLANKISKLLAGNDENALDADHVYLKTFKNIPETDLEILLPGSKVRLSMLDRGKILLPTAMALYKAWRFFLALTAVFFVAKVASDDILALLIVAGAIIGYVFKSVMSYIRTKDKYQFGLTKSLYLKNLGNNSGVLYRILNEAEEQELLETVLGYSILWQSQKSVEAAGDTFAGMSSCEMDAAVEAYLAKLTNIDIDFEVFDSLGKLARLGLAEVDADGNWRAIPIADAERCLDDSWTRLFHVRGLQAEIEPQEPSDLFTQ